MKILQVIPYFSPKRGGDVNVVYNISKELYKRGHEITIMTTDFEFDEHYASSIDGIEVISFRCLAKFKSIYYSPEIKKWLKDNLNNFDIIHLHTYRSYQNNIIKNYSKNYKIPYVLQAHGAVPLNDQKQKFKKIYNFFWGKQLISDASMLFALNNTEKDQYIHMGADEDRIEILPNGIDLSDYENLPDKGIFRKKNGINDDEKIVLYLGRIHETKGIDILVDAFTDIHNKIPDSKLLLIGPDDGYQNKLAQLIKSNKVKNDVVFPGFISEEEKKMALVDADVFVTPKFTGFPVTFVEACACGTPIITTDEGDRLDWIHDNVGYVVEYDTKQLSNAIYKILNDDELKKRFGERGKKLVRIKFNWDKIVKKIETMYENMSYFADS